MPGKQSLTKSQQAELRQAIEQMYFSYRTFTEAPDRILAQRGLGRVHHRILYFVSHNPQISVNALLSLLKVSKQALNEPLRQLVEMKLVALATAEHDRRVRQLSLTPTGVKLESQLTGTQMKLFRQVFAQAGDEAKHAWQTVMALLSEQA